MLKYVNTVYYPRVLYNLLAMRSIKVFMLPGLIIKKLGLTKIYYWFNR